MQWEPNVYSILEIFRQAAIDRAACADVGQRWVAHAEHAIKQYRRQKHGSFPTVMLERSILSILKGTFEQNIKFLDIIISHMDRDGPLSVNQCSSVRLVEIPNIT